jgi:glycosyltransferase involved in cell wall biosynthesis
LTSERERRALADLDLALAPTIVIPNGVDEPRQFSIEEMSPDVRAMLREGFDILCFGRITWKKGLERLIKSVAGIAEVRALIAGHDEDGHTAELRAMAEQCGVADRVRFLPHQIDGADKEALFASARLFALPSLSENFGNVVAEAMVRGLPVVVSDGVGAADIVEASGGGVVVRGGDDALTAALAGLWRSNGRTAMGAAGAAYVRQRLNWDGIARRFEELYRDVAGRTGDGHRQSSAA